MAPSTGLTGPEKINAAFNNGPEALIETIRNTFGIPISHWIVIDFDGVIDSVQALGGIQLDFRYPVRDDNDGVNESGLNITQTGCQTLNGSQASRSLAPATTSTTRTASGRWIPDTTSAGSRARTSSSRP